MKSATGVGVKTGLTYDITNELQAGVGYSYDENFQSKITGNLKWRFGGGSKNKKTESLLAANPVIQALSATPENRDVRVANNNFGFMGGCYVRNRNANGSFQPHFWSWNCWDGISPGADTLVYGTDPRRNVGWRNTDCLTRDRRRTQCNAENEHTRLGNPARNPGRW